jgi:hypothetical protein
VGALRETDLALRAGAVWRFSRVRLDLGGSAGVAVFLHYTWDGLKRNRTVGVYPSLFASLSATLGRGIYVAADLEAQVYVQSMAHGHAVAESVIPRFALTLGREL